jgi:small subunit ribosomal protein S2
MLTNFQTIRKSVERMKKVEEILASEEQIQQSGGSSKFTKKERLMMSRELEKLEFSLGGIRDMNALPALLFVIDIRREDIAVKEANRLDLPVVALVDTNCDPESVLYPIPSNDDGTRAIRLFCRAIGDAIMEGRAHYQQRVREESEREAQERRREKAAAAAAAQEKKAAAEKAAAEAAAEAPVESNQAE